MVDLMGKKFYFFGLSALIILAGIIGYFVNGGFRLDIQFKGGSIIEIQTKDSTFAGLKDNALLDKKTEVAKKAEEIVQSVTKKTSSAQISQTLGTGSNGKSMYLLTINIANVLTGDEQNKLDAALKGEPSLGIVEGAQMQVQNVQPFIGKEILQSGLYAIFWSSLIIILYVWFRFKMMSGLSAGVMAVLALLHDALIMLSVYTIFKIPLNDAFIAAVLTIIGYSMNDTIIIYDRIRENSNLLRKTPVAEMVNRSIVQTLARSINTVVTVLICIVTVFIFASYYNIASIKEFTTPLIVGITSGCYSSIFIASPLWVLWKESQAKKKIKPKAAKA